MSQTQAATGAPRGSNAICSRTCISVRAGVIEAITVMTVRQSHRPPTTYKIATWMISKLPRPALGSAARLGGWVHYLTATRKRRNYLANLSPVVDFRAACPPWRAFQNQALNVLELLKVQSETNDEILGRMTLHGAHRIDAALEDGSGLILPTFHSGNWELSGLMLALLGYPVTTIAGEQLRAGWSNEVKALKERFGLRMAGENGRVRDFYRDLASNRIVALHIDGDVFTGGIEVSFLGRTLRVPRGPAHLSRVMSAPVALTYCRRSPDNHLDVFVEPPMRPPANRDGERSLTQSLMSRVEKCIVEDPGQWCIFRNLFDGKTKPMA
jgi:lauroyl/myristoyl acyltransferase